MKVKSIIIVATMLTASIAKGQLADQDLNKPFGWSVCTSATSGDDYELAGGGKATAKILTSTGGDMKTVIKNAISNNSVVVLDGSNGDFVVSAPIEISGKSNKTIVGINGARICTQFCMTDEIKSALDKAGVKSASTSSGTGGTLSNGSKVSEAREYLTRQTIIDLTGDASEAYKNSGCMKISNSENIIVRNLKLAGPGSVDVGGADVISCTNSKHVWIDHCDFTDGMDGNLDITNESDYVTVSWCTFSYTERSYDHMNTNLIGSSDSYTADEGKLKITYANCIWGNGCKQRMPMGRYGTIHVLNNYYNCAGNSAAINPRKNSKFVIEGNNFAKGVKSIFSQSDAAAWQWKGANVFTETYSPKNGGSDITLPYSYTAMSGSEVPDVLTQYAGATLKEPLMIGRDNITAIEAIGMSNNEKVMVRVYTLAGRLVDVKEMMADDIYVLKEEKPGLYVVKVSGDNYVRSSVMKL